MAKKKARTNSSWQDIPKQNLRFESYYQAQGIIAEDEWGSFLQALRDPLPTTFRISGSIGHATQLRDYMEKEYFTELQNVEFEGNVIPPPSRIQWYPARLAYSFNVPRSALRRQPKLKSFQRFLVSETNAGNVSRQEAVSMIPPLLMDIESSHSVLDLCAAPGSKTAQMIEALHSSGNTSGVDFVKEGVPDQCTPSGVVIANDSDYKRAHMLVHQIKRLNSPNAIIVNHDATMLPNIKVLKQHASATDEGSNGVLKFDRILADVPCSGDGTFRKNFNLWLDWKPSSALGLHSTQLKILTRGLQMLKVGGRLVYSTCSMNPIENEAVLCAALEGCDGKVHLVDISDKLPGLKYRQGLRTWKVLNNECEVIDSYNERQSDSPRSILPTMWPPSEEKVEKLHTERWYIVIHLRTTLICSLRIYPHHQDTGGFFVAVLEKTGVLDGAIREKKRPQPSELSDQAGQSERNAKAPKIEPSEEDTQRLVNDIPQKEVVASDQFDETAVGHLQDTPPVTTPTEDEPRKIKKNSYALEEPFKFLPSDHDALQKVKTFYCLSDTFPIGQFLVRNLTGIPTRGIYFVSGLLKDVLTENENRVRFVHGGIKTLVKYEMKDNKQEQDPSQSCAFRITHEGCNLIYPYLGSARAIGCDAKSLSLLLEQPYPVLDVFSDSEFGKSLHSMSVGCCILTCDLRQSTEIKMATHVVAPLWRSVNSCSLMVGKEEKEALMLQLWGKSAEPSLSQKPEIAE